MGRTAMRSVVVNGPHVGLDQTNERLCVPGCQDELDLQAFGRMQVDDGAQVPRQSPCSGRSRFRTTVSSSLNIFHPGKAVTKCGKA